MMMITTVTGPVRLVSGYLILGINYAAGFLVSCFVHLSLTSGSFGI